MKKAGIILIVLQVIALVGGIAGGSLSLTPNALGIAELLGFCLPGIIGVILLIKAKKNNKEKNKGE
ncbi:MAG: hypothetical protein E7538_01665 [Ruminococcaceae bacterium]|nr:hypothetical protein [Oscillospiraceae bacterium]